MERIVSDAHLRGDKFLAGPVMARDATRHDFRCRERPCRRCLDQLADAQLFPTAGMIELDSCRFHRTHFTDGLGVVLERRTASAAEKDVRDGGLLYRRCPFVDVEDDVPKV